MFINTDHNIKSITTPNDNISIFDCELFYQRKYEKNENLSPLNSSTSVSIKLQSKDIKKIYDQLTLKSFSKNSNEMQLNNITITTLNTQNNNINMILIYGIITQKLKPNELQIQNQFNLAC